MILAFDTHYLNDTATTACVCFEKWTDATANREFVEITNKVAPYEPGRFYKRELPCIVSLLKKHNLDPDLIIVDGYVWLDEAEIGLGGHLYRELGEKIPVVGVAKTTFRDHAKVQKVLRGQSQAPLYVSAIGIDLDKAAQRVETMDGNFRVPTLLKRVDQLCRGIGRGN
jgi:deoxyribonuclease V